MKTITTPPSKPRPQAVTIRMAENADGPAIGALVVSAGFAVAMLDWSEVYPWWLVAVEGDAVVGCIQVCPAKPVARLEMMATAEALSNRARARVVKSLLIYGLATLNQSGAQLAAGMVPEKLEGYRRILQNRGARVISEGALYAKLLR